MIRPLESVRTTHYMVLVLIALVVSGVLLARMARQPMQPMNSVFGKGAYHYYEHATRLHALQTWRELERGGAASLTHRMDDLAEMVRVLDHGGGNFTPLLHLTALGLGAITGHRAEEVLWIGLLWLLLLAASVGACARAISGSSRVGMAAMAAALLFPAAAASATRYSYELPLAAMVWAAAAAGLNTWDRRPVLGGIGAGVLLALAHLIKWNAIPFGYPLVVAAACCPHGQHKLSWRRRAAGLAVTAAACFVFLAAYLRVAGPESPMYRLFAPILQGEWLSWFGAGGGSTSGGFSSWVPVGAAQEASLPWKLFFYVRQTIFSLFSPLLSLFILALLARWAAASRRGWQLLPVAVLTQVVFLVLIIKPLDDRFIFTAAPALIILAVIGWSTLQVRARRVVAALYIAAALLVTADFNLGLNMPGLTPPRVSWEQQDSALPGDLRLGQYDSTGQHGWSHASNQKSNYPAERARLWRGISRCRVELVLLSKAGAPVIDPAGDDEWLRYRSLYARVEEGGRPLDLLYFDEGQHQKGRLASKGRVLGFSSAPGGGDAKPQPPSVDDAWQWRLDRLVKLKGPGRTLGIWASGDSTPCPPDAFSPGKD